MRRVLYPGTRKALPHPWLARLRAARGIYPPKPRRVPFRVRVRRLAEAAIHTLAALTITAAALSPVLMATARL